MLCGGPEIVNLACICHLSLFSFDQKVFKTKDHSLKENVKCAVWVQILELFLQVIFFSIPSILLSSLTICQCTLIGLYT